MSARIGDVVLFVELEAAQGEHDNGANIARHCALCCPKLKARVKQVVKGRQCFAGCAVDVGWQKVHEVVVDPSAPVCSICVLFDTQGGRYCRDNDSRVVELQRRLAVSALHKENRHFLVLGELNFLDGGGKQKENKNQMEGEGEKGSKANGERETQSWRDKESERRRVKEREGHMERGKGKKRKERKRGR